MTASIPPRAPHTTTAADIRTRAALSTLLLILVGLAIGVGYGQAWGQALPKAILGSLAGLTCWTVYHPVCRQHNGLITVSGFLAPLIDGKPRAVRSWILLLSVAAVSGLMFGAWARRRDGLPGNPARPEAGGR